MLPVIASLCFGFVFGLMQSFLFGVFRVGRWDGGHGIAWGGIIALPSTLASIWTGWWGLVVAATLAASVFLSHEVGFRISRRKERHNQTVVGTSLRADPHR